MKVAGILLSVTSQQAAIPKSVEPSHVDGSSRRASRDISDRPFMVRR